MASFTTNEKGEVICMEHCPVCGEYSEVNLKTGECLKGIDCKH